jgi:hypothetical protein
MGNLPTNIEKEWKKFGFTPKYYKYSFPPTFPGLNTVFNYGALTLGVKSTLNENLGGILGGTQMLNGR